MFSKFEIVGAGVCVAFMAAAIFLVQTRVDMNNITAQQPAALVQSDVVVVQSSEDSVAAQRNALIEATDSAGKLKNMVIDDIKVGTGVEVKEGDVVSVHYVGRLQDGTEFDNSRTRGSAFDFKVGGGQVIRGWEEGLLGMKVGGERILVIPPEKGYGAAGIGPIPGNATLIFSIELLEITE
jgi:FKBP-type peptidyl-prolyl cis-trans isomerase